MLYGGGDSKLGAIINGTSEDGRGLRSNLLNNIPALDRLMKQVGKAAKSGSVTTLDGSRLLLRSKHKALNTLLQGGGAIVMKTALLYLDKWVKKRSLDVKFVGNIHDEVQAEVTPEHVKEYCKLAEKAMEQAGKYLKLNVPLSGEAVVGNSWDQTH